MFHLTLSVFLIADNVELVQTFTFEFMDNVSVERKLFVNADMGVWRVAGGWEQAG